MATVNKETDFCSNLPTKWLSECVDRHMMEEPAIKYSLASEKDCKEKNFLWNRWTGCSSECSHYDMSNFNVGGEDRCVFDEPEADPEYVDYETEAEVDEVIDQVIDEVIADKKPVEDKEEALVTAVTPARADACQDAKVVGKAVGHF